ncbi:MAG: nuclear transport factor 2 family protein [Bacteroidetes bacterium]|nr:nuclear transport factor 2 family protein [Bacteroidota bacterium]
MKNLLPVVFLFILVSCFRSSPPTCDELIRADTEFYTMCKAKGFHDAFLYYADDSVIKIDNHSFPVIGKTALEAWLADEDPKLPLQWKPVKAEISQSGDLGYTFGYWKLPVADTVYYGNYVTVWKKQKDGSWKYVLDGGSSCPKPEISF